MITSEFESVDGRVALVVHMPCMLSHTPNNLNVHLTNMLSLTLKSSLLFIAFLFLMIEYQFKWLVIEGHISFIINDLIFINLLSNKSVVIYMFLELILEHVC